MLVNTDKSIGKPFLKSANPLSKKWIICIKYKNSQNEPKEWKRTYELNQPPYVVKGQVITNTKVAKARLKLANDLINALYDDLKNIEFDVEAGDFVASILDKPLKGFINDWLVWKKNKVKASSFQRYNEKINVFQDWLYDTKQSNVSLKRFDFNTLNTFLNYIQNGKRDKPKDGIQHNKSYNYYLSLFRNLFKYLTKIQDIQVNNITDRFEKLKENDTDKHAPYSDYQQAFEDLTNHNYYLGLMAKWIFYSLHRIETITSLQYKDFDLSKGIINIPSNKIKTSKKLTIRISKHLLPTLIEYVNTNQIQQNDYFFGNNGLIKNSLNLDKTDVRMFGQNKTSIKVFSQLFRLFKQKKSTNKDLFTDKHTLYGMKHSGIGYYKDAGLNDHQIIKLTGHSNVSILATYSRQYDAVISEDLFNSLP